MPEQSEAMMIAMRVLSAMNEKRAPASEDVDWLYQHVPDSESLPPDELACSVVREEVIARAALRKSTRS